MHCRCVWYSRHYAGGSYEVAFGFALNGLILELSTSFNTEQWYFNIAHPQWDGAPERVRILFDRVHPNRDQWSVRIEQEAKREKERWKRRRKQSC